MGEYWRGRGLAGRDVDGDPVLWEKPALLDWKKLSTVGEQVLICCEILCMEEMAQDLDRLTVEENRPVHRFGVVIDLEGLPMTFALPQHLKILRRIIAINSELHPERLKWVLL